MFAVIAENDESQWSDDTGSLYHFPKRYGSILLPGTKVIYYKGKMREAVYATSRLTPVPHYFGIATIGDVYIDKASSKGDLFAVVDGFQPFATAVASKTGNTYFEVIPANRTSNYWRDGVRRITTDVYEAITNVAVVADAGARPDLLPNSMPYVDDDLESALEGSATLRYVTTYERDPRYRKQALAIHGLRCKACDVDMGERYGSYAAGFIHVHHVKPVSEYEKPKQIDPALDLVPVCPNCHAVIHRKKTATLSISDLRRLLSGRL